MTASAIPQSARTNCREVGSTIVVRLVLGAGARLAGAHEPPRAPGRARGDGDQAGQCPQRVRVQKEAGTRLCFSDVST